MDSSPNISRKWKIHSTYVQIEEELPGEDWFDSFVTTILDAKCEKADVLEVVNSQRQLTYYGPT